MNHHRFLPRRLWFFCVLIVFVGIGGALIGTRQERHAEAQSPFATTDPNKEWEDRIRTFFTELIANTSSSGMSKPFDELLRGGPLASPTESESIKAMRTNLDTIKEQFGPFKEYEKIDVKPIGKDLILTRYLLKCDQHPVVWNFSIYRRPSATSGLTASGALSITTSPSGSTGDSTWFVIGVKCDAHLDQLLVTPTP